MEACSNPVVLCPVERLLFPPWFQARDRRKIQTRTLAAVILTTPPSGPVLIIAPPGDAHALVVAARIENLASEVLIWDSARLPSTDHLSLYIGKDGDRSILLESSACGTIDLANVRSIWWRRSNAPTIPSTVQNAYMRWYCRSETDQLLRGVLSSLRVPIYNEPDVEERASRKPFQLAVAAEVGFAIPQTIVTCSPDAASDFCETSISETIIKPFRAPAGNPCGTQSYQTGLLQEFSLLRNAPAIFQERIAPYRDVRVAAIGRRLFAAISQSEMLDWRVDGTLTWAAHKLPVEIESMILAFMHKVGLTLGHFDFRLSNKGQYVFFEVNPSGQFLFLEIDDHQIEVTSALAELLTGSIQGPFATDSESADAVAG